MNADEFRKQGKAIIDYICNYAENIAEREVGPTFDPGYLKPLLPAEAPLKAEKFEDVLEDFEKKIMPGVVHWNHPKFFAYFPSGNSFPSILGDLLSSAIGSIGFSWASCPAATELETVVLDWYAKALGLPKAFITDSPNSTGGGALQGSASECTLVCLITARSRVIHQLKGDNTEKHESDFLPQLIAYSSNEAHSSVEKAAKMALVKLRILETDNRGRMRVDLLRQAIQNDLNAGLTPFFVVATVGTTGACAFDDLVRIGQVCKEVPSIWFHVDGAYAGNSFILPEMRDCSKGLEYADSFNTNPNKLLLTNFDASAMWVKDVLTLKKALNVDPLYLQHEHNAIDYRHYGIPLSRRFRSLKLWFVFRTYGISGLQSYIRNHMALAKKFEMLVRKDDRFEVCNDVRLGLVCFRMRVHDVLNCELLAQINSSAKMHMIPSTVNGKYAIRFCVTYEHATEKHIVEAWNDIKYVAEDILRNVDLEIDDSLPRTPEKEKIPITTEPQLVTTKPPIKKKLTRTKSMRFSFTRSISREMYESKNEHLKDGCTPILVVDTNTMLQSFLKATAENQDKKLKGISDIDTDEASN